MAYLNKTILMGNLVVTLMLVILRTIRLVVVLP